MIKDKYIMDKEMYNCIFLYCLIIFLFNLNPVLDVILAICLSICFFKVSLFEMFSGYIFFSFFDDALSFELLGGSLSRVLMLAVSLRLFYIVYKEKKIPYKKEVIILAFLLFQIVYSVLIRTFAIGDIIIFMNFLIFLMFSTVAKRQVFEGDIVIKKLLIHIVIAVFIAIVYGCYKNNFLLEETGALQVFRFKGTYEPNFMGMYINIAIVILLYTENVNKYLKSILLIILLVFLGLTLSVTGIIVTCIIFCIYIFKKGEFFKRTRYVLIIGISSLVLFGGGQYIFNIINSIELGVQGTEEIQNEENNVSEEETTEIIQNSETTIVEPVEDDVKEQSQEIDVIEDNMAVKRGKSLLNNLKSGDIATLTSGRLPIFISFLEASFNRNIIEILLGNGLSDEQLYCDFFGREKEAHNSYLNCLYNFGVLGFVLIIIGIYYVIKNNTFLNLNLQNSKYEKTIKILRITFLIYALVLSLYTKKMILVFFLI